MSLPPRIEYSVPEETARVAWEIFPEGNLYMQWYETFGTLFEDRRRVFNRRSARPVAHAVVPGVAAAICRRVIGSASG